MKGIVIETTNLRAGGSVHEMADGQKYHFKPNEAGRHVCTVTNRSHAMRFLKIDGFQPYMGEDDDEDDDDDGVSTDIDDDDTDLIEDDDDEGEDKADREGEGGDTTEQPSQPPAVDLAAMSDDDLAKLHVETVGRPPHPNAKRETIEARVKEAIEGQAPAA